MRVSSLVTVLCLVALIFIAFQLSDPLSSALPLTATVDIKPDTINLKMQGTWITAYITSDEFDVRDINLTTILLEHIFRIEWGEIQEDALMVKFSAPNVLTYLQLTLEHLGISRASIPLLVTGQLKTGAQFEDIDYVMVMIP